MISLLEHTEVESHRVQEEVVLSLPEVSSLCARAARASGFSWGLSEECGKAAVWLSAHQFDWAPSLILRLAGIRGATINPAPNIWKTQGTACPIHAGATLTDFSRLAEGLQGNSLVIGDLYNHIWFLPFVACASQLCDRDIDVYADATLWAKTRGSTVSVTNTSLNNNPKAHIILRSNTNRTVKALADPARVLLQTTTISRSAFTHLENIALRMTVPATQESQARAGGTGSDND